MRNKFNYIISIVGLSILIISPFIMPWFILEITFSSGAMGYFKVWGYICCCCVFLMVPHLADKWVG
jgi:hypothetical protein